MSRNSPGQRVMVESGRRSRGSAGSGVRSVPVSEEAENGLKTALCPAGNKESLCGQTSPPCPPTNTWPQHHWGFSRACTTLFIRVASTSLKGKQQIHPTLQLHKLMCGEYTADHFSLIHVVSHSLHSFIAVGFAAAASRPAFKCLF